MCSCHYQLLCSNEIPQWMKDCSRLIHCCSSLQDQPQSRVVRPCSTPRERVWDMATEQLVAQEFNQSCKSSHDVSDGNCQSKTCDHSAPAISITTVFQLMIQDTSCLAHFSRFKFMLFTYFRYHVTEYCAVIGTHSTVRGNKLLYGPDPFPRCGIGSGHTRLVQKEVGLV